METKVNYTVVGTFVILLLTAIILAIIWLSSGFSLTSYKTYLVYMQESVSGLNIDSPVEFNGVGVGTVKGIKINHQNPQLVELLLNVKNDTPITKGTVATVNTRGFTGFTYIALKDKSQDLRPLSKLPGQAYPVIKTAPSLFLRIDTALSQLTRNFKKIADSMQALLDKENLESIKKTLASLQEVTAGLAANNQHLTKIMINTAQVSKELTPLVETGTLAMRMLEQQTLPTINRLMINVDTVVRDVAEMTKDIKQNPSIVIRGVDRQDLGPGERK